MFGFKFPSIDFEDFETWLKRSKYQNAIYLSNFDHWLSEDEVGEVSFMGYKQAGEIGKIDEFFEIQNKFLAFYETLSAQDIIYAESDKGKTLKEEFAKSRHRITNWLRNENSNNKFSLFFPKYGVLAIAGWDFTDLLLLDKAANQDEIEEIAKKVGLFVIKKVNDNGEH